MSDTFGEFEDGKTYTVEQVAKKWGKSIVDTRQILIDNFHVANFGGGFLLASGTSLRLDVERLSASPGVISEASEPHRRRAKPKPEAEPAPSPRPPKRRKKGE